MIFTEHALRGLSGMLECLQKKLKQIFSSELKTHAAPSRRYAELNTPLSDSPREVRKMIARSVILLSSKFRKSSY
jgi:hypothetical protein